MNSEMVVDYDVTWWPGGAKYIVCRMHRVRTYSPEASERNADATDWLG